MRKHQFSWEGHISDLGKTIAWYDGYIYRGLTWTEISPEGRLIVRASSKTGKHFVKIIHAHDFETAYMLFCQSLTTKTPWEWRPDKYAK